MAAKKPRGRPFQKGQSGNPAGRKPEHPEIRERLKDALGEGLDCLLAVIRGEAEAKDKIAAVRILYDFGLAKPAPEIGAANAERLQTLVDALKG